MKQVKLLDCTLRDGGYVNDWEFGHDNIVTIFEEQFGRPLSPIELNIIKDWKESDYSDEMIVKALKEAVKSQVLNFRYVEGILNNWAKNGIKQRYVESEQPQRKVPISEYKWWENE